jgi:outer membrane protein assembly factor BamB
MAWQPGAPPARSHCGVAGALCSLALAGAFVTSAVGSSQADAASGRTTDPNAFTVYHGDATGSGVVPAIRSVVTSRPAWTSPTLDGQIYGEPLVAAGRVYVATENDTVYALSSASGAVVWSRHLGTPVPSSALPCGDITPEVGITGTPVIDLARAEIFVVADESLKGSPSHRLVGLSIANGTVEMSESVDPPGADTAAILQRTGLALDVDEVVFGFGGNDGDCSTYHGWVAAASATGGSPIDFEVDAAAGDDQGAIWMGGAAPAVKADGDILVEAGNGSVKSTGEEYDDSDSVLELSPSLRLLQYFAPSTWPSDNAHDLDLSMEPILLAGGDIVAAGKSRIAFLLNGERLGGIGGQEAELESLCSGDIDGGSAVVGTTIYLPCLSGIVAVSVDTASPSIRLRWSSGTGGGPPIVAGGLVWTIGQNGELYGLDPATGAVRQQASVGSPANHFPTPSVGDGLLLAPSADQVVAFTTVSASGATTTTTAGAAGASTTTAPTSTATPGARNGTSSSMSGGLIAGIVVAGVAVGAGVGWLIARRRRSGGRRG